MSLKQRLAYLGATGAILLAGTFLGPVESGPKGPQLTPYADIGGVPTWCYGETVGRAKARYSVAECDALLLTSVRKTWAGIERHIPTNAPDSVKAAMLSVAYNTGVSGWVHPAFLRPLAREDWSGVCSAITAPWQGKHGLAKGFKATVKGKPVRGLENRRKAEEALCRQDLP